MDGVAVVMRGCPVVVQGITVAGRLASGVVQVDVVVGKVLEGGIVLVAGAGITISW